MMKEQCLPAIYITYQLLNRKYIQIQTHKHTNISCVKNTTEIYQLRIKHDERTMFTCNIYNIPITQQVIYSNTNTQTYQSLINIDLNFPL